MKSQFDKVQCSPMGKQSFVGTARTVIRMLRRARARIRLSERNDSLAISRYCPVPDSNLEIKNE